jgi:Tfp pilus assembly major pilin PilA
VSKQDHVALVERYRDYANGGAKTEDIRLSTSTRREYVQVWPGQALHGTETINTTFMPATVRDGSNKAIPKREGSPIRRKFTQYYSSGGHVRGNSKTGSGSADSHSKNHDMNLLG